MCVTKVLYIVESNNVSKVPHIRVKIDLLWSKRDLVHSGLESNNVSKVLYIVAWSQTILCC